MDRALPELKISEHIRYKCLEFSSLTTIELYAILQLRQEVFVVEQKCAYLDTDGSDFISDHFLAWDTRLTTRQLAGYLRIAPPGTRFDEHSLGRIVTATIYRGVGVGRAMIKAALEFLEKEQNCTEVRISAQEYLSKFYGEFGFEKVRGPYPEDGIPHIEMLRSSVPK